MKVSERFALNEWLSDYPENATYEDVLGLIGIDDESVVVWQWFEGYPSSALIENIDNTQQHFQNVVNNLKEGEEI